MRIMDIRPVPPGNGSLCARVDVELSGGVRLFNIALKNTQSGWRAYAPSAFGSATATFTSELAAEIIEAARAAMGEIHRNDQAAG